MHVSDRAADRRSVVEEIAARRASTSWPNSTMTAAELRAAVRDAPPPRPIAERLAAPGLHLIAELKRALAVGRQIAAADDDIVARARAYEAGGAAAISVLCEPHWFGGSVADLRAVRAAVAVPVLAKDFVVEARQLPMLRAAGADLVLLLAVLHPAKRLARLVAQALELGLEPLVEAHDARELERALASDARLIGLNNRDLRTLEVDVERAGRLRDRVPDDRLVIAESGVRDPATIARWRALGFDGALVGEALMRDPDPAAAVAALRRRRSRARRSGQRRATPICQDLRRHRRGRRARRDPRRRRCDRAQRRPRHAPRARGRRGAPTWPRLIRVGAPTGRAARRSSPSPPMPTPDLWPRSSARSILTLSSSTAPNPWRRRVDRATDLEGAPPAAGRAQPAYRRAAATATVGDSSVVAAVTPTSPAVSNASSSTPPAGHILVAPASASAERLAAAIARELPVTLAGGLHPANVAGALRGRSRRSASMLRPASSGRASPGARPARIRSASRSSSSGPAPPGTIAPTSPSARRRSTRPAQRRRAGRWGMERDFGGRYVPETLIAALEQLETAYDAVRQDPVFWAELRELLERFAGRPTRALPGGPTRRGGPRRGSAARVGDPHAPAAIPRLRLYLKREDLAHTGAHKINNALGQALLTRRLGKNRVIAETGAGQHGVATATACALLDLPCVVYMGARTSSARARTCCAWTRSAPRFGRSRRARRP